MARCCWAGAGLKTRKSTGPFEAVEDDIEPVNRTHRRSRSPLTQSRERKRSPAQVRASIPPSHQRHLPARLPVPHRTQLPKGHLPRVKATPNTVVLATARRGAEPTSAAASFGRNGPSGARERGSGSTKSGDWDGPGGRSHEGPSPGLAASDAPVMRRRSPWPRERSRSCGLWAPASSRSRPRRSRRRGPGGSPSSPSPQMECALPDGRVVRGRRAEGQRGKAPKMAESHKDDIRESI